MRKDIETPPEIETFQQACSDCKKSVNCVVGKPVLDVVERPLETHNQQLEVAGSIAYIWVNKRGKIEGTCPNTEIFDAKVNNLIKLTDTN